MDGVDPYDRVFVRGTPDPHSRNVFCDDCRPKTAGVETRAWVGSKCANPNCDRVVDTHPSFTDMGVWRERDGLEILAAVTDGRD